MADPWDSRRGQRGEDPDPFPLPPLLGDDQNGWNGGATPAPPPTRGEGWVRLDDPAPAPGSAPLPSRRALRRQESGGPGPSTGGPGPANGYPDHGDPGNGYAGNGYPGPGLPGGGDPVWPPGAGAGSGAGAGAQPSFSSVIAPDARGRRGPLLPLLAALLLGWTCTSLLSVQRPALLGFALVALAAVSPLVSVLALPVLGLALRRHRWVTLAVATLAAVGPWIFVLGYATAAPRPAGDLQALRVLVVNAQAGNANAADIVALSRQQAADLLVVTEASDLLVHDLTTDGIDASLNPVSVTTAGPAQAGLAIYSRYPLKNVTTVPGTHWPAVRGMLDTGHGTITVVAGHPVPPGRSSVPTWAADLKALERAARVPGPVLVVGSLNATPWNAQFRAVSSGPMHDSADLLGRGLRPNWPNWLPFPVVPLDHVLVGDGVGVTALSTAAVGGTDHRALIVDLAFPHS